jgi:AraC-like DNA-binding protein
MNLNSVILAASPVFSPYIEYYKFISGTLQGTFKVVPSDYQELYFQFDHDNYSIISPGKYEVKDPQVFMSGLHDVGQEIYSSIAESRNIKSFVIVFKPNGIQKLFSLSNSEIQRYALYGNEVLKAKTEIILDRMVKSSTPSEMKVELENFLIGFIDKNPIDSILQSMNKFIRQNIGIVSVGSLAEKYHITPRTLQRRFKDEFGICPKNYLQLVRINTAVGKLSSGNYESLTYLAYYSGYYDQSHFIRDVKKNCGTQPGIMEKNKSLLSCANINFTRLN